MRTYWKSRKKFNCQVQLMGKSLKDAEYTKLDSKKHITAPKYELAVEAANAKAN